MRRKIAAILSVMMLAMMPASGEMTYGPGHEAHEYACWDNGDDTHTVACDCGTEKLVELHTDGENDGVCDYCGAEMAIPESEPVIPDGWKRVWNEESGIVFAVPGDMAEWMLEEQDVQDGLLWRGSNSDITVQLKVYAEDGITYDDFINMLYEYEYTITDVMNVSGTEITVYSNPEPGENMQLCGAVLVGADGRLCKISVFNGDNDEYLEDAAVWELADTFMKTIHVRPFLGWNIYRRRTY